MLWMPLHPTSAIFELLPLLHNNATNVFYKQAMIQGFEYWYYPFFDWKGAEPIIVPAQVLLDTVERILSNQAEAILARNREAKF